MADINIERKKKTRWPWILLLIIVLIVIAWLIYEFDIIPVEDPMNQLFEHQEKVALLFS